MRLSGQRGTFYSLGVALYCLSNVDFARGTDVDFLTDDLEVVATEEITVGANDLVALGLSFTGVGILS